MPLSLTYAQHRNGRKLIARLFRSPCNTVALRSEVATMTLLAVRLRPLIPVPFSARTPGTQAIAPFSAHTTNAAHSLFILPALSYSQRSVRLFLCSYYQRSGHHPVLCSYPRRSGHRFILCQCRPFLCLCFWRPSSLHSVLSSRF